MELAKQILELYENNLSELELKQAVENLVKYFKLLQNLERNQKTLREANQ